MPEMAIDKPKLSKEEEKVYNALLSAKFTPGDIKKHGLVNFALDHKFTDKELALFCKYRIGGVPESDFGDLRKDGLALKYGFTSEEAIALSKTKAELNGGRDFKDNPVTIGEIVQRMENLGGKDRDAAGWSDPGYEYDHNPEFARSRAIFLALKDNETFDEEGRKGGTIKKIWQLPSELEEGGYFGYSDQERVEDLTKAGFEKDELEFYLNLGKELDIPKKYFTRLCAYFEAGVSKGDSKEFMESESLIGKGIALKYDFSDGDALALSKTKTELNRKSDFKDKPATIMEIIGAIKALDGPEGSRIREAGLIGGNGTPEQKRICSVDYVFAQENDRQENAKRERVRERILSVANNRPVTKTEWASE